MNVIDTNDTGLRTLIHDFPRVIAKFTSADCATCELLAPPLENFANNPRFRTTFLRLNSDENPVAKKLMNERVAPFFVAYCRGRMVECDTQKTEQEVLAMLENLQSCSDEAPVASPA